MKASVNSYGIFLDTFAQAKAEANKPASVVSNDLSIEIIKTLARSIAEEKITSLALASSTSVLALVPKLQELSNSGLVEIITNEDKVRITDLGRKVAALST